MPCPYNIGHLSLFEKRKYKLGMITIQYRIYIYTCDDKTILKKLEYDTIVILILINY